VVMKITHTKLNVHLGFAHVAVVAVLSVGLSWDVRPGASGGSEDK